MKAFIIALIFLEALLSGASGWYLREVTMQPQIIETVIENPVVVERLVVQAIEVEKIVYKEKPVYLDRVVEKRVITPLSSTQNVDFDRMLHMIELGITSHQFKVDNPILHQQFPGHPVEQEWVELYRKLQEIIKEIQARQ